jgi:O-antigen/teichoic acid export membrane protein
MLNQILISYIFFQRSNISAIHLFKTDAVFSVLDKLIMIVLSSLLIWGHFIEFQLKYFVYTQTIAYAISAIIISIVVYSKSKPKETSVYKSETKGLIKNSLPYAFMVLLMTIYMRLDILLLTHLLPNGEMYAGIYAQSYRILEAASMFSILFAHWLLPIFTRLLSDSKNLNSIINLSFFVLLIFSTIITFGVFFYHQEIMHRLYQNQTNESAQILSLLIFSFIPISINYIFGTLLTAGGKMKILLLVSFFGVLISIASNIILIRRLQGLGTALAANILYYTIAFFQIYFSIKTFHIKLNTKKVKRYFIFLLLIIFLGIILKSSPLVWIINFCIFVMLGILLAMALNIFSIKNIVLLIKEK